MSESFAYPRYLQVTYFLNNTIAHKLCSCHVDCTHKYSDWFSKHIPPASKSANTIYVYIIIAPVFLVLAACLTGLRECCKKDLMTKWNWSANMAFRYQQSRRVVFHIVINLTLYFFGCYTLESSVSSQGFSRLSFCLSNFQITFRSLQCWCEICILIEITMLRDQWVSVYGLLCLIDILPAVPQWSCRFPLGVSSYVGQVMCCTW